MHVSCGLVRQVAAALALGADGAVLGTRLVATHECLYSLAMKVQPYQPDQHPLPQCLHTALASAGPGHS